MPDDQQTDESIADFAAELFPDVAAKDAPAAAAPAPAPEPTPAPAADQAEESLADANDFIEPVVAPAGAAVSTASSETEDNPADFMAGLGIKQERDVPDITKPWMKFHKFERVKSIEQVREIVDACLKSGRCALDTETEGLDTRINYDALGNPRTVHQIVGYCISHDGETGYYIPVRHNPDDGGEDLNIKPLADVSAEIKRLCQASQPKPTAAGLEKDPLSFKKEFFAESPKVVIYFCNAKFDQEMLYPITGIDWWHPDSFEDCQLAAFCHYSADKALGLKHKAPEYLRDPEGNAYVMIELKELFLRGRPIKFATLSPDEPGVIKYGCSDAICTYLLCEPPRKHEKGRVDLLHLARTKYEFTYRLEKQVVQVVRVMERYRCKVDRAKAKELLDVHQKEFDALLKKIQAFGAEKNYHGLDPSSSKQLSEFLFSDGSNCLNITPKPEKNEASGQYKTDGETLEGMVASNPHAPPILKWIVEYRGLEKTIGTYLEHLYENPDKNDELRFNFKQTGTGTGRFSAPAEDNEQGFSGVPIHGIPNESDMRKLFLAREGFTFVKCDYAGQELRIAANVSNEPVWIKEFLEGDGDLHSITARAFFNKQNISKDERKMAKIANFALLYGGGPMAIIRATGCDKLEASRRKQAFDKAVPVFAKWIKTQQQRVKKELGVWTPFKRWLSIPDANHPDRAVQAACERYSVNYPIQGSGADIMKISMVMLHKEFYKRGWLRQNGDDSVRMLLSVHDEIVFEIRHGRVTESVPIIVRIMEMPAKMTASPWIIPLITEPLVGPNWGVGYKCEHMKEGYKAKEGETIVNGFVYGTVRVVDLGKDKPGLGEEEAWVNAEKKQMGIRIADPLWLKDAKTDDVAGAATPAPTEAKPVAAPAAPVVAQRTEVEDIDRQEAAHRVQQDAQESMVPVAAAPAPSAAPAVTGKVVVMRIHRLSLQTVEQVQVACVRAWAEDGKLLKLTDWVGASLIEPSQGVRVDATKLAKALDELNLSDGKFGEEN